jgi:hypothetical protein
MASLCERIVCQTYQLDKLSPTRLTGKRQYQYPVSTRLMRVLSCTAAIVECPVTGRRLGRRTSQTLVGSGRRAWSLRCQRYPAACRKPRFRSWPISAALAAALRRTAPLPRRPSRTKPTPTDRQFKVAGHPTCQNPAQGYQCCPSLILRSIFEPLASATPAVLAATAPASWSTARANPLGQSIGRASPPAQRVCISDIHSYFP